MNNPRRIIKSYVFLSDMVQYSSVKISTPFIERIKEFLEQYPESGYRTHSEFIIDAARKLLEEKEKELKERESKK